MMSDSQSAAGHNHLYFIARVLAVLLLFPLAPVLILSVITPLTISGILYLMGTILVVVGYWSLAWKRTNYRAFSLLGLGLIVVVAIVRITLIGNATRIRMLTLPDDKPQCWLNCILDEQDIALFST